MLNRLRIKNFQKHDKLDVTFASGVTTIVGSSDTGKSSIVRALRWVCTNKPNGNSFIRHGSKSTSVRLEFDGETVTRTKGSSNTYRLADEEFHSFSSSVPEKIKSLLKLDAINFQSQHDTPFWFAESAGQVSKNLNEIIDLSVIDNTLSEVASTLRKCRSDTESLQRSLSASQEQLESLSWVLESSAEFDAIDRTAKEIKTRGETIEQLHDLIQIIYQADKKIVTGTKLKEDHEELTSLFSELRSTTTQIDNLETHITVYRSREKKARFKDDFNLDFTSLLKLSNRIESDISSEFALHILEHGNAESVISVNKKALEKLQKQFDEIEVCPTCQKIL